LENQNLKNKSKKVLITGGTHGIGKEICIKLAEEGYHVAFLSSSKSRIIEQEKVISQISENFISLQCDVLSKEEIEESWRRLENIWGGVDILINNVGGGGRWGSDNVLETNPKVWEEVYQKNAGATLQLTLLALPYMVEKKWGRVITITSIYGNAIGGRPWFNLAKVSQNILMRNLARNKDLVRNGITFNSIAPGAIYIPDTGWSELESKSPLEFQEFQETLPLGRLGTPLEVANLVSFLTSDKSSLVNGASIKIDGGESASI
jgi:3-oxoacyl-[acyl-carrier protein] reductase